MTKKEIKKLALKGLEKKLKVRGYKIFCDNCWHYNNKIEKATHIQKPDPFLEEIKNITTIKDFCDDCFNESRYSI